MKTFTHTFTLLAILSCILAACAPVSLNGLADTLETQIAQGQTPIVVTEVRVVEVTSANVIVQAVTATSLPPTATNLPPTVAPTLAATATPAFATMFYTVQTGDTPQGVALTFGIDLDTLIALNAEAHPEMGQKPIKFNAGWQLVVPYRENVAVVAAPTQAVAVVQPTAATVAAGNGGVFNYDAALEIVRLTNEARAAAGVGALTIDEGLMALARKRATELVGGFSHDGLFDDCGDCGENITMGTVGFYSAGMMFNRWLNSPSHNRNLHSGRWSIIGVAHFKYKGVTYGVQIFH